MDLMIDRIIEKHNPTVAGLDTRVEYLPEEFIAELGIGAIDTMEKAAQAILAYNKRLIKALCDIVPAVKVQIAYYEMYGVAGMKAFEETLKAAHEAGMSVMVDAKRNDIGATAEAYATSYLGKTQLPAGEARAFEGDFVTVNAYLGVDGVKPFVNACEKNGGGIFALVKTSNPSSGQLQDMKLEDGRTVYEMMGDLVSEWGESTIGAHGYSQVGAVVGATYPEQGRELRARMKHTFFLVPGYGAQGATGKDIAGCFDEKGLGAIVNASRSLLCAWKKQPGVAFDTAARNEAIRMRDDITANINL
ncbi:MAG: orotidine-5'-phosphate decarboxylase [Clostridiales bacterium]|nr:orotidine-5'-phosphate decarboxylase [Clostridiales bacterium]MDY4200694.1 orotidine-5'-phosphate decarboxylase [Candidatus Fimadaptatus sp.]